MTNAAETWRNCGGMEPTLAVERREAPRLATLLFFDPGLGCDLTVCPQLADLSAFRILGTQTGNRTAADLIATDPVDAVPGPIVGAGLPGLIAACGGLLGWWRRRRRILQA
jgi:hypothetical protein